VNRTIWTLWHIFNAPVGNLLILAAFNPSDPPFALLFVRPFLDRFPLKDKHHDQTTLLLVRLSESTATYERFPFKQGRVQLRWVQMHLAKSPKYSIA